MEKTFCSFYYQVCPSDNTELKLEKANTALLVIDLQRVYTKLADKDPRWNAFSKRLNETVLPNVKKIEALFRKNKQDVIFARIACHLKDGRDRSLSQKMSGWNNILITLDDDSQIIDDIAPVNDEIVVTKTTDSALTGTNLRLILNNLGIRTVVCAGIFTEWYVENGDTRTLANLQVLQSKLNHPRQQLSLKSFHKQTFRSHSHEGSQIHSR